MIQYLRAVALVFAFLFAQVGYTAHLATHLAAPAGHDHGHTSDAPCELCISYAQLGSGPLAVTLFQPPLLAAVQDWVLAAPFSFAPVFAPRARARAPPADLV